MNIQASTGKHWQALVLMQLTFQMSNRHHYHPTSSPSPHTHTHSLYPSFKRSENLHSSVNWAHYTRLSGRFYLTVNVRLSSIERFEITWWWWCPCSNGKYDFNFCMFFLSFIPSVFRFIHTFHHLLMLFMPFKICEINWSNFLSPAF